MTNMIKIRLNSAAQITKETLQSQLKQLNCTYTVSNDRNALQIMFPSSTNPIVGLTYDIKNQNVDVQMAKTNALKGNVREVAQRVNDLQDDYAKGLAAMNQLLRWLSSEHGAEEVQLLITE